MYIMLQMFNQQGAVVQYLKVFLAVKYFPLVCP